MVVGVFPVELPAYQVLMACAANWLKQLRLNNRDNIGLGV